MSYYDPVRQQWVVESGDLVLWLDPEDRPVRAKVVLITDARIYLQATSTDPGRVPREVWFENRFGRRVAPRQAVVVSPAGKAHIDWRTVRVEG